MASCWRKATRCSMNSPSLLRVNGGHSTFHRGAKKNCDNPECRFYGESTWHQGNLCVMCGKGGGGVFKERVAMHFNVKEVISMGKKSKGKDGKGKGKGC